MLSAAVRSTARAAVRTSAIPRALHTTAVLALAGTARAAYVARTPVAQYMPSTYGGREGGNSYAEREPREPNPPGHTLVLWNLSYDVTEQDLAEVFADPKPMRIILRASPRCARRRAPC
jgi:hypothetical protein